MSAGIEPCQKERVKPGRCPLISVITVCLDAGELLRDTIESVKGQGFGSYEYIIVDGGSRDSTPGIVREYQECIDVFVSEPDTGIYNAMNKAVGLSSGRWINFLNAGDKYASEDVFGRLSGVLQREHGVVFGDRYYSEGGKKTLQRSQHESTIFEKMPFGHQAAFVEREVLRDFRFNESYRFAGDYEFFLRLYRKGIRFNKVDLVVCDFLAGGRSESGIRPYLEAMKILLENTSDRKVIRRNMYAIQLVKEFDLWKADVFGVKDYPASYSFGFLVWAKFRAVLRRCRINMITVRSIFAKFSIRKP